MWLRSMGSMTALTFTGPNQLLRMLLAPIPDSLLVHGWDRIQNAHLFPYWV